MINYLNCNGEGKIHANLHTNVSEDKKMSDNVDVQSVMQADQERRTAEYQERLLTKIGQQKCKIKKLRKKNEKLLHKIDDYDLRMKQLIRDKQALEDKNKRLGWMLLQRKSEIGEKLPESVLSGKNTTSIYCLLDADISDMFM